MNDMAAFIQNTLCKLLRMSGLPWMLRNTFSRNRVTVINYHNPSPEVFRSHMTFFSKLYTFICIDSLLEALETRSFTAIPSKALLVTIDDAHLGNAELLPIIRDFNIPVVIYAVAGVVGSKRKFWFDLVRENEQLISRLKQMTEHDRLCYLAEEYDYSYNKEYDEPSAMNKYQLLAFQSLGATIGSHTVHHVILPSCSESVGLEECINSKEMLEDMLGTEVIHFALPNGSSDERTERWIAEAGYRTCRTTEPGWVTKSSNPLRLPNFGIDDDASVSKAVVQASGIWSYLKRHLRIYTKN